MFFWPFIAAFTAALALIKMGAMFVWIAILSLVVKIMTILLVGIASTVAEFLGWTKFKKDKVLKIDSK
jgi:hypothetical protein